MSTSILAIERRSHALTARLADYLEMTKPRIVVLELIVAGVAACLAMPRGLDAVTVVQALLATALVAASASVANSWWEQKTDALMPRTLDRPMPAGRVRGREALMLSAVMLVVGITWLVWKVNLLTAALGLASWVIYALIYTPLKTRTPLNTTVGAVSGAIPALMGWTATGASLDLTAYAIAGVLFLWQFPHFMAIAWLYRRDYAAGGHRMLSVVDPSGMRCGSVAMLGALLLVPVSMIPTVLPTGGSPLVFFVWTFCLGVAQYGLAVRFALLRDEQSARQLLRGTLIYLPTWMVILLMVTL